jgi:tetrachlorobenzoquinone reductase
MIRRISALNRIWKLFYAYGSEQNALFRSELGMNDCVEFFPGGRNKTSRLKLEQIVAGAGSDAHLYCCGPLRLLEEFKELTADRANDTVHVESFGSSVAVEEGTAFKVRLARSNLTLTVEPGVTILEALREARVNAAYSCQEGLCGACEVGVLAGRPDHRDTVLSPEERSAGDKMMICCSRSLSGELVLDL